MIDEQTDQVGFYFKETNRLEEDNLPDNISVTLQNMSFSAMSTAFELSLYSFDSENGWAYEENIQLNENINEYTISRGEDITEQINIEDLLTELNQGRYRLTTNINMTDTDEETFTISSVFWIE